MWSMCYDVSMFELFLAETVIFIFLLFFSSSFLVVKTRLQTINKAKGEKEYAGIVDCFR